MRLVWLLAICGSIGTAGGFYVGYDAGMDKFRASEAKHLKYQLDAADALAKSKADADERAQKQSDEIAAVEKRALERSTHDETTIRDLRAKYSGLRILARCPASATTTLPKAFDTGVGAGSGSGEVVPGPVPGTNGGDLLDDYAAAERIRQRLIECRDTVASFR